MKDLYKLQVEEQFRKIENEYESFTYMLQT